MCTTASVGQMATAAAMEGGTGNAMGTDQRQKDQGASVGAGGRKPADGGEGYTGQLRSEGDYFESDCWKAGHRTSCGVAARVFSRPCIGCPNYVANPYLRTFSTGSTRDTDTGKLDPEGFLSPLALEAYFEYMHRHRKLPDGSFRDSDNWQLGIPKSAYMKSMWRHFFHVWKLHRCKTGYKKEEMEEALCALLFNVMGMLHSLKSGS